MSNDLIESIKSQLANIQGDVDDDTRAVAGASFGKRISIKGGVFRKIANGKEVGAIDERHMEVIFVKMAHTPTRMFYKETYEEGKNVSPECWSLDTKYPDVSVEHPQGESCATCVHSVQGSGTGGKGTACRLSWRTAVVLPKDAGGDVMQLVLPATSVFGKEDNGRYPFRAYIQMLAGNNISAGRVITKMQFDTKATAPKLLFSLAGVVPPEDVVKVKDQADSAEAVAAVDFKIFKKRDTVAVAPAAPPAPQKEITEQIDIPLPEPKLRATRAPVEASGHDDVPDILKKWSKK